MNTLEFDTLPPYHPQMLLTDKQVSQFLGLTVSYLRKQRFLRRKGLPHTFAIDPVLIGKTNPRYRYSDLLDWMDTL